MSPPICQARQFSDQKVCRRCGKTWDMNDDPDPLPCDPWEPQLFSDLAEPPRPAAEGTLVSVSFETDDKTGKRVAVLRFADDGR